MKLSTLKALLPFAVMIPLISASPLPRSTPEAQGISSAALLKFVQTADQEIKTMNSFMVVRRGQVVAEGWWSPYGPEVPHQLFSLSKSFTSTAIGMLVADGKLKLTDPVLSFFPDDAPAEPSEHLKAMRIHDLLIMSTGHEKEPNLRDSDQSWAKAFLAQPVPHKPGTHFLYNTPGSYMLSAIVQKVTGETLLDYLRPRLFAPLGIDHPTWEQNKEGINTGGWGLNLRTEDIAKFGQLYLQKGRWGDRQLLPAAWVEEATSLRTSNGSAPESDWDQGYGYQFWRCRPLHVYRGDGAFGQYCIVMPDQDAVVAITSGVSDMQAVMNLVWNILLPAMQTDALPANPEGAAQLEAVLAKLSVPAQTGAAASPLAGEFAGRRYTLADNGPGVESFRLIPGSDGTTAVILGWKGHEQTVTCQPGTWRKTPLSMDDGTERRTAVSGAWTDDRTYVLKICSYETPFITTLQFQFTGDDLHGTLARNVGFGDQKPVEFTGQAAVVTKE